MPSNTSDIDARPQEAFLFRFAILADTHINPVEGQTPSPWASNGYANARARAAVREINRHHPDFTIHLGDMVHPVPAQESYGEAAARAREILGELAAPVHYVPGNHDIGDKSVEWTPAKIINDDFIQHYVKEFGEDYYRFEHDGVVFVVVNAQLLGSGLEREARQWQWLNACVDECRGKRMLLFTHYPPYIVESGENEHYDNMAPQARERFLEFTRRTGPEAMFCGHVHNFFYNRYADTEIYVLPAASAVRHDYSEMFTVSPEDEEFGRNDNAKLGFAIVDVHERGHVVHCVRSYGARESQEGEVEGGPFRCPGIGRPAGPRPGVAIDLRQEWASPRSIPYMGAVDEFYRKRARDDYALLALWEMGIEELRVPTQDLTDPGTLDRMQVLARRGYRFQVFSYRTPDRCAMEALAQCGDLVSRLEIIVPADGRQDVVDEIRALKAQSPVPLFVSALHRSSDAKRTRGQYTHFISHGFDIEDLAPAERLLAAFEGETLMDGLAFRVDTAVSAWSRVNEIADWADQNQTHAIAYIVSADTSPAVLRKDDAYAANRHGAALVAAHCRAPYCTVVFDALSDMDRGYFPRRAFIDRHSNPRLSAYVVSNLQCGLPDLGDFRDWDEQAYDGVHVARARGSEGNVSLLMPDAKLTVSELLERVHALCIDGDAHLHGIVAGERISVVLSDAALVRDTLQRRGEHPVEGPVLITTAPSE